SLYRCRDYERVGVPMLPVVAGPDETRRQILLYSVLLVPLAMAPTLIGLGGMLYLVVSGVAGAAFLGLALRVYAASSREGLHGAARRLFAFSIIYLFTLFAALLGEHILGATAG